MAYSPATGRVILFGGNLNDSIKDQTWAWDGESWAELNPDTSPPPRSWASMAHDPASGKIVLFGGFNEKTFRLLNDTWTWDGETWTEEHPSEVPPARMATHMAFHPGIGRVILHGGESTQILNDTWAWDGAAWTRITTPSSPPRRTAGATAFHPGTGQFLVFGGWVADGGAIVSADDTQTFGPPPGVKSNWTLMAPETSPTPRTKPAMTYDPGRGEIVLFGGRYRPPDAWVRRDLDLGRGGLEA